MLAVAVAAGRAAGVAFRGFRGGLMRVGAGAVPVVRRRRVRDGRFGVGVLPARFCTVFSVLCLRRSSFLTVLLHGRPLDPMTLSVVVAFGLMLLLFMCRFRLDGFPPGEGAQLALVRDGIILSQRAPSDVLKEAEVGVRGQ